MTVLLTKAAALGRRSLTAGGMPGSLTQRAIEAVQVGAQVYALRWPHARRFKLRYVVHGVDGVEARRIVGAWAGAAMHEGEFLRTAAALELSGVDWESALTEWLTHEAGCARVNRIPYRLRVHRICSRVLDRYLGEP